MVVDLRNASTRYAQLAVRIFGDDYGEMVGILGTADVALEQWPRLPQVVIRIDREAAARYGINVSDITDLIQIGMGGGTVADAKNAIAQKVEFDPKGYRIEWGGEFEK